MSRIETGQIQEIGLGVEQQNVPAVLRTKGGRVRWTLPGNTEEQNAQLCIQNVQGIFSERFPEFNELFPRAEDGKIAEEKREEARMFILDKLDSTRKIQRAISTSVLHKKLPPIMHSLEGILNGAFEPWGIEPKTLPQVDTITGRFVDENGAVWASAYNLAKKLGISIAKLHDYLKGTQNIVGRGKSGEKVLLFDEVAISLKAQDLTQLPKTDEQRGDFETEQVKWVTRGYFSILFGLNEKTVGRLLRNATSIQGRNERGRKTLLFNLNDVQIVIQEFLSLPRVDPNSQKWTDSNSVSWTTLQYFHDNFGLSPDTLKSFVRENRVKFVRGRDIIGKETILYSETDMVSILQKVVTLPQIDPKNSFFTDISGNRWANADYFRKEYGIYYSALKPYIKYVPSIIGRGTTHKRVLLYRHEDVMRIIREHGLLEKKSKSKEDRETTISPEEANEELMSFLEVKDQLDTIGHIV